MVWCKDTWLGFSALLALFSAVSVLWDGGTRGLPFGLGCVDVAYGGGFFYLAHLVSLWILGRWFL